MSAKLTEDDWSLHKAVIQALYLTEDRKLQGPGGVIEQMFVEYKFKATKAQYEKHFKKWGFRKNKRRDDWEATAAKVAKRKRDGKESELWIGDERVPVKKLRKEISRYGYDAAFPTSSSSKYTRRNLRVHSSISSGYGFIMQSPLVPVSSYDWVQRLVFY
ncbi:hypothetical protein EJ04DRAFT_570892 [Polyplosphaeria fusca]|uniref:Clr5 domain-containing protein n=1 Tax=Polyplosphaeria fusca TaxID=682080 RepID=A0A9P4QI47_9PLEO|nr:hypothetical protein EJ04DRAFT_570892 [Polyplosphaeria fusca]